LKAVVSFLLRAVGLGAACRRFCVAVRRLLFELRLEAAAPVFFVVDLLPDLAEVFVFAWAAALFFAGAFFAAAAFVFFFVCAMTPVRGTAIMTASKEPTNIAIKVPAPLRTFISFLFQPTSLL
jgi:hypothetical protein